MKNIWVIANWKSNKTISEALDWISIVGPNLEKRDYLKVVVCPTFTDIEEVKKAIQVGNFPLIVGSQDLSPYEAGAYTGEETAAILRQFVDLAILGHSERRQNFNETDDMVARKVEQALEHNITPLVCIQSDHTPIPKGTKLVAYEPVEAIGTGHPDSPQEAESVSQKIKADHPQVEILYGGSITSENAKAYICREDISGVLVGEASLEGEEFVKIVNACLIQ
ncbi:MAG: triosephosphate isomerase [Candidatus Daviesbacteria bacterium]|nr:MAG: triosephosphate isomerase [Candidatus Daviesbacteria bacterium]